MDSPGNSGGPLRALRVLGEVHGNPYALATPCRAASAARGNLVKGKKLGATKCFLLFSLFLKNNAKLTGKTNQNKERPPRRALFCFSRLPPTAGAELLENIGRDEVFFFSF